MSDHIYVANHTPEDIYVIASESPGWEIADFLFTGALMLLGDIPALIRAAVMGINLPQKIETIEDYYDYMKIASQISNDNIEVGSNASEGAQKLIDTFMKNSCAITTENFQDIRDTGGLSYIEPSGIVGLLDADTIYVIIMAYGGRKVTSFTTNIDNSWIVTESGVVRSKYGTINEEDTQAVQVSWYKPPFGNFIPKGDTCKGINVTLTCQAQKADQSWIDAKFDLTKASNIDLANMNGALVNQA